MFISTTTTTFVSATPHGGGRSPKAIVVAYGVAGSAIVAAACGIVYLIYSKRLAKQGVKITGTNCTPNELLGQVTMFTGWPRFTRVNGKRAAIALLDSERPETRQVVSTDHSRVTGLSSGRTENPPPYASDASPYGARCLEVDRLHKDPKGE